MERTALFGTVLAIILVFAVPALAQVAEDTTFAPENAPADQYEPILDATELPRDLPVEQLFSDTAYPGVDAPQVLVAPSAAALSSAIGVEVPDSGEGTYLAAYWGMKGTGGFSITVESARFEGDRVTVGLALQEPSPYVQTTQAVTYPYAVAVMRGPNFLGNEFSFVDQNGQELDWSVYRVTG